MTSDDVNATVDAAVAVGAALAQLMARSLHGLRGVAEPLGRTILAPPLVPEKYAPGTLMARLVQRGHPQREALEAALTDALRVVVPQVLDSVLDQVDLTQLVLERVDINAVIAAADVDAVVARADLDAVIARIDLIELAETIIDGVDLPEIIRDSTGSIASEGIRGVRLQTIDADERVNRLVDRVLLRRRERVTEVAVPQQRGPEQRGPSNGEAT